MPVEAIQKLTSDSSKEQVQEAISACISQEVDAGRDHEQAVAMCHNMAREQTGGEPAAPRKRGAEHTSAGTREF